MISNLSSWFASLRRLVLGLPSERVGSEKPVVVLEASRLCFLGQGHQQKNVIVY
jgi:hypothetical protein